MENAWTKPGKERSDAMRRRVGTIAEQLDKFLGPEYISYRRGEGGQQFAYVEGHEMISIANTIFGWNGWTSKPVSFTKDYAELATPNGCKWNIGMACTVRVTVILREAGEVEEVYHEDVGYGTIDNAPGLGKGMEKCRKEAMTDGMKRALRAFGSATGGCIYNKAYLDSVKKVKGPADRIEFVDEELFRKPINKRKRLMMQQERAHAKAPVLRFKTDDGEEDEFGSVEDEDWMGEMVVSDELITV